MPWQQYRHSNWQKSVNKNRRARFEPKPQRKSKSECKSAMTRVSKRANVAVPLQILNQAHKVALKRGILRSTPLLKEAREFSAEMLWDEQKKKDKVSS